MWVWSTYNGVGTLEGEVNVAVEVDDPAGDVVVCDLVTVIHDDKEEVKPRHDGGTQLDVVLHMCSDNIQQNMAGNRHVAVMYFLNAPLILSPLPHQTPLLSIL